MQYTSKIGMISLAVVTMMVGAGLAHAGYVEPHEIYFSDSNRFVLGTLRDVRASADPSASIGCVSLSTVAQQEVICWASDTTHGMKSCSMTGADAERVQTTVAGIDDDSLLMFYWDEDAHCTQINVYHGSALGN